MGGVKNLTIIENTAVAHIVEQLPASGCNFTNGAYTLSINQIQDTIVTGFEYVTEKNELPIAVEINSDKRLISLVKTDFPCQIETASCVGQLLASRFKHREIYIIIL